MTATDTDRPYDKVRELIEGIHGTMTWHPMGRGGDWVLEVDGKTKVVECRDQNVNELDGLYVAKTPNPETWKDYDHGAPLRGGAIWELFDPATWK